MEGSGITKVKYEQIGTSTGTHGVLCLHSGTRTYSIKQGMWHPNQEPVVLGTKEPGTSGAGYPRVHIRNQLLVDKIHIIEICIYLV